MSWRIVSDGCCCYCCCDDDDKKRKLLTARQKRVCRNGQVLGSSASLRVFSVLPIIVVCLLSLFLASSFDSFFVSCQQSQRTDFVNSVDTLNTFNKRKELETQRETGKTLSKTLGEVADEAFEAAFQGECGSSSSSSTSSKRRGNNRGSPCEHTCLDLHDGTFECTCREHFALAVDGYSCVKLQQFEERGNYLVSSSNNNTEKRSLVEVLNLETNLNLKTNQQQDDENLSRPNQVFENEMIQVTTNDRYELPEYENSKHGTNGREKPSIDTTLKNTLVNFNLIEHNNNSNNNDNDNVNNNIANNINSNNIGNEKENDDELTRNLSADNRLRHLPQQPEGSSNFIIKTTTTTTTTVPTETSSQIYNSQLSIAQVDDKLLNHFDKSTTSKPNIQTATRYNIDTTTNNNYYKQTLKRRRKLKLANENTDDIREDSFVKTVIESNKQLVELLKLYAKASEDAYQI